MEVKEVIEIDSGNIYEHLWSGGRDTLADLTDEQIDTILDILESACSDYTLTDLNDFFWFERDTIAEWLGFDSYDELMNGFNADDLRKDSGYYFDELNGNGKEYAATTKPLKMRYYQYDPDDRQFI